MDTAELRAAPTISEYRGFQTAYDFFNAELFEGALPGLLVTLQRAARSRGYFGPERFTARAGNATVHEIALNPDTFEGRTDEEILSTLVHEMAHAWQECHGNPGRTAYHNKEWADKMEALGLMPSDTGEPGGKKTGQHMTHYIVPDGPYALAFARLEEQGYRLGWQAAPRLRASAAKAKSKTKFTCPDCGQNAWAKEDAKLACGECGEPMEAAA
jgi:predicted SprT family Zn-dependent metalloprotease